MHLRISMLLRALSSVLGLLFALPVLALIVLAFTLPITISGVGYLLGCTLMIAGLIVAPWGGKYSLVMILTGLMVIVLVAGIRLVLAQNGNSNLQAVTLPEGKETRWMNALIDEQDSLIFGESIFHRIGGDSTREHEQITQALHTAYSEIKSSHRVFASPILSTYLGLQRPASFDTIIIKPENDRHPEAAVIFLHGYLGNVTSQCWEIAQAAGTFGAITVCPSTDWTGAWWESKGQAMIKATFEYLRNRGIEKFYLGGFSNGGFSISRLVTELKKEKGLAGLIFIDGISDGIRIREAGLPVLIIQGAQDERVPATAVRPIAETIGALGTYVELPGDHFLIMKQPQSVQGTITSWLENQEENR